MQETNQPESEKRKVTEEDGTSFGFSDEEFQDWISKEILKDPLSKQYPAIFEAAPRCIANWRKRYRGNLVLWKRLFSRDRVIKEFLEAVPVIDAVDRLVKDAKVVEEEVKFTIIDLASGKGYLSMLLSELLPPEKIERFVLVDKAWSMRDRTPKPHHINWDHIYGTNNLIEAAGNGSDA